MWQIVLIVVIVTILAGIFVLDYSNYLDLQRRLEKEREENERV